MVGAILTAINVTSSSLNWITRLQRPVYYSRTNASYALPLLIAPNLCTSTNTKPEHVSGVGRFCYLDIIQSFLARFRSHQEAIFKSSKFGLIFHRQSEWYSRNKNKDTYVTRTNTFIRTQKIWTSTGKTEAMTPSSNYRPSALRESQSNENRAKWTTLILVNWPWKLAIFKFRADGLQGAHLCQVGQMSRLRPSRRSPWERGDPEAIPYSHWPSNCGGISLAQQVWWCGLAERG